MPNMKQLFIVGSFLVFNIGYGQTTSTVVSIENTFQSFLKDSKRLDQGAGLLSMTPKEETRGSRFLLDKWVKGHVENNKGVVIDNEMYRYYYDKLSRKLLVTQDQKTIIELDNNDLVSFSLKDGNAEYLFMKVPALDRDKFYQQLVKGDKYTLYKLTKTRLEKADYTNAILSSSKKYDEYIDEQEYYIRSEKTNTNQKVSLKKKSITGAFGKDNSRAETYMTEYLHDDINESFLKNLVTYLNQ